MSRLTASRAAFDLIASFEGFRSRAVLAPDGQWTLGFGHIATAREGLSVTRAEAEDLLRWDLLPIEDTLRQIALTPLSQNQFDALVSFAFNIGLENFKASDVLKYLNQGQPVAAALSMHAWRRALVNGRVLTIDALVRRRAAESALFLETVGARPAAPSSVIKPQIDYAAALLSHTPDPTKVDANTGESDEPIGEETPLETATDLAPSVTLAEAVPQDVVVEAVPLVTPSPIIPPLPDLPDLAMPSPQAPETHVPIAQSPMVPQGLSPFPGTPIYQPANGSQAPVEAPANDASTTRLHNAPEVLSDPKATTKTAEKAMTPSTGEVPLWVWGLIALGAALLAFGLFFSWRAGILSVASPRQALTPMELTAILAAASGFILMVSSTIYAFGGGRDES
jgi:lysozyme